jgi:hypothetical protein
MLIGGKGIPHIFIPKITNHKNLSMGQVGLHGQGYAKLSEGSVFGRTHIYHFNYALHSLPDSVIGNR